MATEGTRQEGCSPDDDAGVFGMVLDEVGDRVADDVDAEVVFAGIIERSLGELGRQSGAAQFRRNFGVRQRKNTGTEAVFEIGGFAVVLELESSVGDEVLGRFGFAKHRVIDEAGFGRDST